MMDESAMNGDAFSGVGIRVFLGKGGVGKTTCAAAMAHYGLKVEHLIVNNVITAADSPFLAQKGKQQQEHLRQLRQRYDRLPITKIPLFPHEIQGLKRLRQVAAALGPGLHEGQ